MTDGTALSGWLWETSVRQKLREKFPPEQIGKLPRTAKRPELDFVGHAAVSDRLNTYVPDWSYTIDERFDHAGQCWIRGTMTIGGVSRPEYGDGADPKEAIGNFIRRSAMRFGVAIDLWSREELSPSEPGVAQTSPSGSDPSSAAPAIEAAPAGTMPGGEEPEVNGEADSADGSESPGAAGSKLAHFHGGWLTTWTDDEGQTRFVRKGWATCGRPIETGPRAGQMCGYAVPIKELSADERLALAEARAQA